MKTIKLFIIFITGLTLMNTVLAEPKYSQSLYSLEFNIYGTGAEIRLNDIPVYYHDSEGQTNSQKPVPESIIDGENILSIKSFPLEDNNHQYMEGAYIEAIISIREKNAPLNENKPILQLKLNPTNSEDKLLEGTIESLGDKTAKVILHSEKQSTAERRTHIDSPFPKWEWQEGQIIEDTEENFQGLLSKYKEIWDALNSANIKKITTLYDNAAQEFAVAYHYTDKQQGHRLMDTGGLIDNNDWILGDINTILKKVKFRIVIYANGHLAHIVDEDNDPSLITYLNKKMRMINTQKYSFYKNTNGEWIMIR